MDFNLDDKLQLMAAQSEDHLEPPSWTEKVIEVHPDAMHAVEELTDTSYLHNLVQYNIMSFNCATLAHVLLEGYGISCMSSGYTGKLWLPGSCQCDSTLGACETGDPMVGQASLRQYLEHEANTKTEANAEKPNRNSFNVHNWDRVLPRDDSDFKVYVVKTWIPQAGSYHASLLLEWGSGKNDFLSFSGWPFDTIDSVSKGWNLISGRFRVVFPDPTLRTVAWDYNKELRYVTALVAVPTRRKLKGGVLEPVEELLPFNDKSIVNVEEKANMLHVFVQGKKSAGTQKAKKKKEPPLKELRFARIYRPDLLLELTGWPSLHLVKDESATNRDKWKYYMYGSAEEEPYEEILPFCIIRYAVHAPEQERFYLQRPTILRWMKFFFSKINSDQPPLWQRRNVSKAKGGEDF